MNITNIIYYNRNEETETSRTISLRELCLRDEFDLEDIFIAVRDAIHTQDLLDRLRRIICDPIEFDCEERRFIRFTVTDIHNNTNYLKFRKERDNGEWQT